MSEYEKKSQKNIERFGEFYKDNEVLIKSIVFALFSICLEWEKKKNG